MATTAVLNLGINTRQALASLNNFNGKLNQVGKTVALRLSAPLLALEVIAVKTFSEMEKGLTDITNLASRGKGFAKFSSDMEGAQESAVEMGFAIDDVNKSLFDTVSALGQGALALDTYAEAQKLAKGGNAQLSETVDGLTSVINAYGRETTKASDVSNAFFTAQKQGKTTVAELSSNIGKVAPIAKSAGIGFKELLATMAEMTLGGLSTDEATTSLRATISALVKPAKEAEEVLRELGVPVGALELKEKGLGFALAQLSKAQKENADILAKAIPNIRALTGVTSFNDEKLQHLQQTQDLINQDIEKGTGLNEAYTDSMNDMSNITAKTMGVIKTFSNDIGKLLVKELDLKNALKDLTAGLKDLKNFIKDINPGTKKTIAQVLALTTAAAPLVVAMSGLVLAVSTLSPAIVALIPALAGVGGPVAAIGIAAGVTAIALLDLSNAMDEVRTAEQKLAEQQKKAIKRENELKSLRKSNSAYIEVVAKKEEARLVAKMDAENQKRWEDHLAIKKEEAKIFADKKRAQQEHMDQLKEEAILRLAINKDNPAVPIAKSRTGGGSQFSTAIEKGSIEAIKLENSKIQKIQDKQYKETRKQTAILEDIRDSSTAVEVGDF